MRHTPVPPQARQQLAAYFDRRSSRFEEMGKARMKNVFARLAAELLAGSTTPARALREAAVHIEYAGCSIPPEERRV